MFSPMHSCLGHFKLPICYGYFFCRSKIVSGPFILNCITSPEILLCRKEYEKSCSSAACRIDDLYTLHIKLAHSLFFFRCHACTIYFAICLANTWVGVFVILYIEIVFYLKVENIGICIVNIIS